MSRLARALLLIGIPGIVLGLSKVHAAWVAEPAYDLTGSARLVWAIGWIVLLLVAVYATGLPDVQMSSREAVVVSVGAPVLAALAMSVVQLVAGDALLPRFVVFGSTLLIVPLELLSVWVATGGRAAAEGRDRVVVVAGPEEVAALELDLAGSPERPAQVVGSLDAAAAAEDRALVRTVEEVGATLVVLDRWAQADDRVVDQAGELHERGLRVRTLPLFYDQWLAKLPVSELGRLSLMFDIGELHRARYGRLKRVLDLVVAVPLLVVLVVLLPFVAVGDLVANRGPLLYRQPRVGRAGREFTIYKLRTMRPQRPGDASEWTKEDDDRITPFGALLRTTHLDELPQVWNVLRGDLAIVGPRPEQPRYVVELSEKLPFYDLRHLVRPGLTGWAQVKYGYAGDEVGALEKLQYEFWYLRHQSLPLDMRIVGRTLRTVVGRDGR